MIVNGRGYVGIGRSNPNRPISIITDGLKLYLDAGQTTSYPGTGTVWTDISGNGKNGTLINGPTYSSANNGSIVFDGTNDNVSVSGLTAYGSTNAHTYAAWVKPSYLAYNYNWVINNGSTTNGTSLIISSSKVGFFYQGGSAVVFSSGTLIINNWYYITATYNGSNTVKFYINGVAAGVSSISGSWSATNTYPNIGTWYNGSQYPYTGNISNVQIYNRALSDAEITQNYNTLKSRFGL